MRVLRLFLFALACTECANPAGPQGNSSGKPGGQLLFLYVTGPTRFTKIGETGQLMATGTYANGAYEDVTSRVSWSSSNSAVAMIASTGAITIGEYGTSHITATLKSASGFLDLRAVLDLKSIDYPTNFTFAGAGETA